MRIELTFPDQSQETTDLKSGTGTSSVTSPLLKNSLEIACTQRLRVRQRECREKIGNCKL